MPTTSRTPPQLPRTSNAGWPASTGKEKSPPPYEPTSPRWPTSSAVAPIPTRPATTRSAGYWPESPATPLPRASSQNKPNRCGDTRSKPSQPPPPRPETTSPEGDWKPPSRPKSAPMPISPWSSSPTTPCCAVGNCSPSPGATSTCRPTTGVERFGSGGRRPTKPAKALSRPSQNALFRHSPASSPPTPTPATEYSFSHPKPLPAASEPQLKPPGSIPPISPATPCAWEWPKTSPARAST